MRVGKYEIYHNPNNEKFTLNYNTYLYYIYYMYTGISKCFEVGVSMSGVQLGGCGKCTCLLQTDCHNQSKQPQLIKGEGGGAIQ